MTERDTKFRDGFAKLLRQEIFDKLDWLDTSRQMASMDDAIDTLIAQRAYDLEQSGCIDINNAQMQQGVRLHPHAMLRAVQDLTQWPESPTFRSDFLNALPDFLSEIEPSDDQLL